MHTLATEIEHKNVNEDDDEKWENGKCDVRFENAFYLWFTSEL